MHIYFFWIIVYTLVCVLSKPIFSQDTKKLDYKERVLLEDFESTKFTNQSFHVKANTNYLPDVRMSKLLSSPDLISNTSLLVRIPSDGTGIPMDLIFKKPYVVEDYLIEFEFYIYSNQANGELFLYLLDTRFQKHKILIANLNYDGWKSFKIPIGNRISQSNYILGKPAQLKLTGILFHPALKETKNKEDIIAIDDIFIVKRKKLLFPNKFE